LKKIKNTKDIMKELKMEKRIEEDEEELMDKSR
jgi:hypothetical protein